MGSMSAKKPVYLVCLVYLVGFVELDKQDKPNKLKNHLVTDPGGLRST
jgi:hypothetical protein